MGKGYELVNFCEFDSYAVRSYCAIHNEPESKNLGDITLVDETKLAPFNMICGGSPCQDFSVAGKLKGAKWICKDCKEEYNPLYVHWSERDRCPHCGSNEIDKTRSSLLVEWLRIVRANKPNWGIYENVKNLVGKAFKETTFKLFVDELSEYGYNVYWKVLNAKNYDVPQNRERVYVIFIKKELDNGKFVFPTAIPLTRVLRDVLDDVVDEKYYLSDRQVERFITNLNSTTALLYDGCQVKREGKSREYTEYSPTLTARDYKDPRLVNIAVKLGNIYPSGGQNGNIYDVAGISPTILSGETSTKSNGGVGSCNSPKVCSKARLRKLTPKECWRLFSFSDEDFTRAKKVNSDTQLYKQAGNSIVVDVLYYIFVELYKAMPYLFEDLRLGSYFSGIGAFETGLDRLYTALDTGNFNYPHSRVAAICGEIIKLFDIPKEILNDNERQRRVYSTDGIAPTILGRSDSAKIVVWD